MAWDGSVTPENADLQNSSVNEPVLRIIFLFVAVAAAVSGCGQREEVPGRLLFLGDSITEEGGFVEKIAASLLGETSGGQGEIMNRGRASETISGLTEANFPGTRPYLLDRLDKELSRADPDWVVAGYGMNCGLYQPFDVQRFDAYKLGVETLIQKVRASGSRLVLLAPPPFAKPVPVLHEDQLAEENEKAVTTLQDNPKAYGYVAPYPYYDQVLRNYSEWLKTLESRDGVWVIDVGGAMRARLAECYEKDPVHPNRTGHEVIAKAFLDEWPRILSEAAAMDDGR